MRRLRIALGSNDGETIVADHMGTAKDCYVFDLFEDERWVLVEKRENTSPEEKSGSKHGEVRKLASAMTIFEDCDVVLGRRGSPNFVRMRDTTTFQPVVTRVDAIAGSLLELASSFEELHRLVERRKRGERPQDIPIVGRASER